MTATVVTCAPAKLNLVLSVGPPNLAHLHPICSWMVTVDLADVLTVTRLPADRFSRYAILWHEEARRRRDIDWSITQDLAVLAHLALERHTGRRLPVQLKLEKRIPVGGGLGGGSANAAAMLHTVNELFDLRLSDDELAVVGGELGHDIPFLVHGGSAIVEGTGHRVEPRPLPELHAVVVLPDAACSTPDIYRLFDERTPGAALQPELVRDLTQTPPDAMTLFNDLADAVLHHAPAVREAVTTLAAIAERPAHVTGSGSSVFTLCDDPLHASFLAERFEQETAIPAIPVRATTRPRPAAVSS